MNFDSIKQRIADQIIRAAGSMVALSELESGWRPWLATLFPTYISSFSEYHVAFWTWIWAIEKGKQPKSFVAIWPRGGGKSTAAELATVALGARKARKYILYVSATQEQADDHVQNVGALLESSSVEKYYPDLATRALNKFGSSKGWRRNRLRTLAGFTIDALGLDTAQRGVKLEEQRPDTIIVDDIDQETDSAPVIEKKIKILTRALIPAGASDLAILFIQNLVHKDSVFARLVDGRADFLADRIMDGPTPALKNFTFEREDNGRYVITSGEPTWSEMGLARCQEMIDDMGLLAFRAECQHEVDLVGAEKDFREYNEIFHVITWSEYARGFEAIGGNARDGKGQPWIPQRWYKGRGLDWGTTTEHPTAIIYVAVPSEADPLASKKFIYREIVRPRWPPADREVEMVSPGRIASAIRDAERPWAEMMVSSLMSHEASAALATFVVDLPDDLKVFFSKWKPRRGSGVPQVQEALTINYSQPHPFRKYPDGYFVIEDGVESDLSGQAIMGCPSLFIVVEDGQGELYLDNEGALRVRSAINEKGFARLRAEMPIYNQYNTGQAKLFDDAVNALCGLANTFFVPSASLNREQRIERELVKVFHGRQFGDIMELLPEQRQGAIAAWNIKRREIEKTENSRLVTHGIAKWKKKRVGTW